MLMQTFGGTNKEYNGIFESGLLFEKFPFSKGKFPFFKGKYPFYEGKFPVLVIFSVNVALRSAIFSIVLVF